MNSSFTEYVSSTAFAISVILIFTVLTPAHGQTLTQYQVRIKSCVYEIGQRESDFMDWACVIPPTVGTAPTLGASARSCQDQVPGPNTHALWASALVLWPVECFCRWDDLNPRQWDDPTCQAECPWNPEVPVGNPLCADPAATVFIVDDLDANVSSVGVWQASAANGHYNGGSQYADDVTATFTYDLPDSAPAGMYNVYVWYAWHANRGANIPYTMPFDGGQTATWEMNHQSGGGRWVLVGLHPITPLENGDITVSAAQGQAGADAVKYELVPPEALHVYTISWTNPTHNESCPLADRPDNCHPDAGQPLTDLAGVTIYSVTDNRVLRDVPTTAPGAAIGVMFAELAGDHPWTCLYARAYDATTPTANYSVPSASACPPALGGSTTASNVGAVAAP